jgi:hypothetical protein
LLSHRTRNARRATIGAALAVAALVVSPGSALGKSSLPESQCSGEVTQPFAQWGDSNDYTLAPGGDFETPLSDWSLTGGAAVSSGSESFGVTGSVGASSLSVPVGSVAVSAPVCVDPTRENFRFFARNSSTSKNAKLKVEILYPTKSGDQKVILGGILDTAKVGGWQLSPAYSNSSNLALLSGLKNPPIQYRFTTTGGGWQVDDIYVDPRMRH